MARHPRLVVPGVALHVHPRGNDRQDCFRQDADRLVYLSMLRECASHRRCAIHAYCLMSNHVHLLVTPQEDQGCALLMRDLGRGYAAYFNRRYGKTGALWERPFRSCLVDSADYVIACYRYIERNPVKAHMVDSPAAYPWSSYFGNAALRTDPLLTPHAEYLALGLEADTRQRAYVQLLDERDSDEFVREVREATEFGYPLIGEGLRARLEKDGVRLERGKAGRPLHDPRQGSEEPGQLSMLEE
jgi:putative transposase